MNTIESVLLIDDDEATNFFNKMMLENSAFNIKEISVARNGQIALDYLNDCHEKKLLLPNIIFLDINMPIMNGWEFLKVLTTLKFCDDIQIIAMLSSSFNDNDKIKAATYDPVKKFLRKPLTEDKINVILENYFDGTT